MVICRHEPGRLGRASRASAARRAGARRGRARPRGLGHVRGAHRRRGRRRSTCRPERASRSSCATGPSTWRRCTASGTPGSSPCRSTHGCTATRSPTSSRTARRRVVIADPEHADDVDDARGRPGRAVGADARASPAPLVDRGPEDPAWLFYTSGTTGKPKGATLTNRNLLLMSLSYYADIDAISAAGQHPASPRRCRTAAGSTGCRTSPRGRSASFAASTATRSPRCSQRWPGMSFFAAPTMVKRLATDPADGGRAT